MKTLFVSFNEQNLRMGNGRAILKGRRLMWFELLALLALRRYGRAAEGWVTIEEIGRLPNWSGRSRHHVSTNIGRCLQAFDRRKIDIVAAETRWAGRYRLKLQRGNIRFDIPLLEVERRLGFRQSSRPPSRLKLLRFALHYARAQSLFFQGRIVSVGPRVHNQDSAYRRLLSILEDQSYGPRLRLIALLGAVQALFQLGRFGFAREMLVRYRRLLQRAGDNALTARYYLALAWSLQRGSSGSASDRATLNALRNAAGYVKRTTDREVGGTLAYRMSGYLTKHGHHFEAVAELLRALEADLAVGNYHNVQAYCVDIGSDLHRLGSDYYREAQLWILLGVLISEWMQVGSDNAHGETILGKMYVEKSDKRRSRWWLQRAMRISEGANNMVSLGDAHMIMALWHQRFGSSQDTVASLTRAVGIFRGMMHFDFAQKESYMARKFPEVWRRVLSEIGSTKASRK